MASVHETAYPRLKQEVTPAELEAIYTPTTDEIEFVFSHYRRPMARACLLIQLKLLQRLGYVPALGSIPQDILVHICRKSQLQRPRKNELTHYERTGDKSRHMQLLRKYLNLQVLHANGRLWLAGIAEQVAHTKQELADIINVMVEELIHERYELPGFTVLDRMARSARTKINEQIFNGIANSLSEVTALRLELLIEPAQGESSLWHQLKREPKRPGPREVASFLAHIEWLMQMNEGLPSTKHIAVTKRNQLTLEAKALDQADLRSVKLNKRQTLIVLLIQSQLRGAMDDIAEMFIKMMAKMHSTAEERLHQYRIAHARQVDQLIGQFREVLTALQEPLPAAERLQKIETALDGDPTPWLAQCDEYIAFADNNYYPFLLDSYRMKRWLLFQCLDVLKLKSTTQDDKLMLAIEWILSHRSSRRPTVAMTNDELASLSLGWLSEKWRKLVIGKTESGVTPLDRRYFELCVCSQIAQELKSGDLYVENSDQYDDTREQLVSWDEFQRELPRYGEQAGIPTDAAEFVRGLREKLVAQAKKVDQRFPANEHVELAESGLSIRRHEKKPVPANLDVIEQRVSAALEPISILDLFTETESWLDLHKLFGPLSGLESKLDEPRKRFISTLFCYGCNLGPSQTARSVKGLSRKQVAWLNLHHVTEERLDKAMVKVVNAFNRFALPKYWGTGKHVSADGTKWNVYEQNLLSEYHIRYGGYGGIGYYHVSDMYIALFSRFIPCGAHEAVYILDALIRNESDIKPDTVHGDTQAQSATVFGLSHLLGIKLMPRIRNIRDLIFFKPEKGMQFEHIGGLFKGEEAIDWDLIETHYADMLRVAISIKAGKITPSMILRRLGTANVKNRLYFAFRELGRVIRTMFLLDYINDVELRRTIQAATNKSEQFNDFVQWLFFGGEGVIAQNLRHEQRKIVKYNHLAANMVILHNVQTMSRVLKELQLQGVAIDAEVLGALSPYRKGHINRFGDYWLDLLKEPNPLDFSIQFHV